ncbi:MAG: 4-(cytidine 5-diphospho)-2-C-methyl-D-erythritol kinase, partial [Solirubrobacterales bacterium]|nr:4-(cytidine 5-diphospho)-2-C-methyl-D-erythritol kinase [Solirubrobacterales bacterium]
VAAGLGADVPAQVLPGRYLTTGAGERVEALAPVWPALGVLVLPGDGELSTPAVYREFDRLGLQRSPDDLAARLAEVRAAVTGRAGGLPPELLVNDLAPAALSLMPGIQGALDHAREAGADHVLVSGSGPTVLGLFSDARVARGAAQALRRQHPRLVLTEPVAAAGL